MVKLLVANQTSRVRFPVFAPFLNFNIIIRLDERLGRVASMIILYYAPVGKLAKLLRLDRRDFWGFEAPRAYHILCDIDV